MNAKNYEKPELKFVSLRNEETVAATCWGHHGSDTVLYCDIPGEGYCSFQIGGGSCTLNLINVWYYSDQNGDGEITSDEHELANDDQVAALEAVLKAAGGESGNPFKGEGSTVVEKPDPSWS